MQNSYIFWQGDVVQTVPNNLWTPLLLNTRHSEFPRNGWQNGQPITGATTVAAGSNGAILPQATIQLEDTTTLAAEGFLAFRMPGTKDVAVRYTGKTPTSITGCTGGVGTLTTGMAVRQGNVYFHPNYPSLCAAIAEVAFANNAVGLRGIRVNFNLLGLAGGQQVIPAVAAANPLIHVQTCDQPAFAIGSQPNFIEVYQSSGGDLDTAIVSLSAPRLVVATLTSYTGTSD